MLKVRSSSYSISTLGNNNHFVKTISRDLLQIDDTNSDESFMILTNGIEKES